MFKESVCNDRAISCQVVVYGVCDVSAAFQRECLKQGLHKKMMEPVAPSQTMPHIEALLQVAERNPEVRDSVSATAWFLSFLLRHAYAVLHQAGPVLHIVSSLFPKPGDHHAVLDESSMKVYHFMPTEEFSASWTQYLASSKCQVVFEPLQRYKEQFGDHRVVRGVCCPERAREVLSRARSRLSQANYNFLFNNCEHFATWCFTGTEHSQQTSDLAAGIGHVFSSSAAGISSPFVISAAPIRVGLPMLNSFAGIGGVPSISAAASSGAAPGTTALVAGSVIAGVAAHGCIQFWKKQFQSQQPIRVVNHSNRSIKVSLKTQAYFERLHNTVHGIRAWAGMGKMVATIDPLGIDELSPPCEEGKYWFEKFELTVTWMQDMRFLGLLFVCFVV